MERHRLGALIRDRRDDILDRALHTAVRRSIERYTEVRERTLQGFDRIAAAALESRELDDLLRRLLQVLHETTPAIDMSSIYLRDDELLRVRAAVGIGREAEEGLAIPVGEGFAGAVAASAQPMTLHEPPPELLRSPLLAAARVRVLHGVPIFDGTAVIGVANIASCTADDFSLQDRRIFAAMVARASAAILQHLLREQAQHTARQLAGVATDNARLYHDAQAALRLRDDVLAIVSHDLRSPLGTIDLAVSVLRETRGSDARDRRHLDAIRRAADRMEHLIDDLLDMASINVGRLSLDPKQLDAGEVIREALDIHEPLANERGIAIVRASVVTGIRLRADRDRLIQVFGNVLGNAIKFCSAGDAVTVRCVLDAGLVRISIADTGPGISRAELPHIFEPYWSGRAARKRGNGLGLFITKALVEAHGGTIAVASEEGYGATFEVTLPVDGA